jgi:hypothetical protein
MEKATWSLTFARQVAEKLGYEFPDVPCPKSGVSFGPEGEAILKETAEAFRFLPFEKIQEALDFADFLRTNRIEGSAWPQRHTWITEKHREVRDFVLFLKSHYGEDQPADERDYWTDEDRKEAQLEIQARLRLGLDVT